MCGSAIRTLAFRCCAKRFRQAASASTKSCADAPRERFEDARIERPGIPAVCFCGNEIWGAVMSDNSAATRRLADLGPDGKRWIAETLFDDLGVRMSYRVDKVLYEARTAHQHLVLFEQPIFGKMLMLDGATQITAADEFIYQEMMAHVPLFAHGNAREVLIIGGGDCGIAEEVLKHKTVRRLTQVEIDAAVVEFAKEHFPEFAKPVFADQRFASVIETA